MDTIHATKSDRDYRHLLKTTPKVSDITTDIIQGDTIVYEGGKIIAIYKLLAKPELSLIKGMVGKVKYTKNARSGGIPTQSAIFGSLPRIAARNDYCRVTADTKTQQGIARGIMAFSDIIDEIYRNMLPGQHDMNIKIVRDNVVGEYIIGQTPFTTINFNVNHAIKYHLDTGNFKGVYSNVLIVKEGISGGHLICPEYNMGFEQSDGALILFDGQSIIHGVTPIRMDSPNGYRSSCVFYSLANMKNCYPYGEELTRIKSRRDVVESKWRGDLGQGKPPKSKTENNQ